MDLYELILLQQDYYLLLLIHFLVTYIIVDMCS